MSKNSERDKLWNQLANAIALVSKQDRIIWTIFGVFWAANALLLNEMFSAGVPPTKPLKGAAISGFGFIMSAIWFLIQWRANNFLTFYTTVQEKLESELLKDHPRFALNIRFNLVVAKNALGSSISVRPLMKVCAIVSAGLWLIAFILFLCRYCSGPS